MKNNKNCNFVNIQKKQSCKKLQKKVDKLVIFCKFLTRMSTKLVKNCNLVIQIPALQYGYLAIAAATYGMDLGAYLVFLEKKDREQPLPCPGVASERVGEPKLVREVLPEVVGGELAPVMELVDDLELGLREPEEEGRDE